MKAIKLNFVFRVLFFDFFIFMAIPFSFFFGCILEHWRWRCLAGLLNSKEGGAAASRAGGGGGAPRSSLSSPLCLPSLLAPCTLPMLRTNKQQQHIIYFFILRHASFLYLYIETYLDIPVAVPFFSPSLFFLPHFLFSFSHRNREVGVVTKAYSVQHHPSTFAWALIVVKAS